MIINEFEYVLKEPLKNVGINGNFTTVEKLYLRAPSKKLRQYTGKLKQGIKQSELFKQMQLLGSVKDLDAFLEKIKVDENKQNDISDEEKGKMIISDVLSSSVNWQDFEESFKQLCINGCCIIDDKHPMTSVLYDNLSNEDGDAMLGLYLVKFFL